MNNSYQVLRIYNNNAILVLNQETKGEAVLVGKGIGYGRKNGETQDISPEEIEKYFLTYDDRLKRDYLNLIQQLDEKVLSVSSEIIYMANERIGPLSDRIHIVLTDHIGFALERIQSGMEIHNPFLDEIKMLYPQEYEVGLTAQSMIQQHLGVQIVEDEVAFIALHISAAREQKDVKESVKNTRMIKDLVDIIEDAINVKIPKDLTYSRLVHHLRGTIERIESGHKVVNPLLETLKRDLKESFEIALILKTKIERDYGSVVSEDEVGFMAIHIDRLKRSV
ncbi:PRD domain-containing protein [Fusibacter bizertensis]